MCYRYEIIVYIGILCMKNGNRWRFKCGENDMYLFCG